MNYTEMLIERKVDNMKLRYCKVCDAMKPETEFYSSGRCLCRKCTINERIETKWNKFLDSHYPLIVAFLIRENQTIRDKKLLEIA